MLEGEMALELEGKEMVLTPEHGEFCVKRWTNHRIYPPASSRTESGPKKAVCLASGEQSALNFQLDFLFFENWYAYQDLLVVKGQKPDLVQIMSVSATPLTISLYAMWKDAQLCDHSFGMLVIRTYLHHRGCLLASISHWASASSWADISVAY